MKKLLFAAALTIGVVAANADMYDQPYDGTSPGGPSQNFSDFPDFSTYLFDDINTGAGWTISNVLIRGEEAGSNNATTAIHLRFSRNASFTNPGTIGGQVDLSGGGALVAGNITFSGLNIALASGTWYMTAWIDRPFGTGGQWFWRATTPVTGSEAMAHNPGGGGGFGGNPVPLRQLPGFDPQTPRDLSFQITYAPIPEPGTFLALGVGLAALAALRRRK